MEDEGKMGELTNLRVAILVTDGFEDDEFCIPDTALREAGADVDVISLAATEIQGFRHLDKSLKVMATRELQNAKASDYDALMLPGGALNADHLRGQPQAIRFVQNIEEERKPIAAICHAPWLLISAGLVRGRTLTSYASIQDDIRNAGGNWVDREVVIDQNWVTSRGPEDLPAFTREMLSLFSRSTPRIIQVAESA